MRDSVPAAHTEMLVPAVARNAGIWGVVVSLFSCQSDQGRCRIRLACHAYLDDASDKAHDLGKFAHVYVKMSQFIFDGLGRDNPAPLADGAQAPQVASGVQIWVWWFGQIDLGDVRGEGRQWCVWSGCVIGAG